MTDAEKLRADLAGAITHRGSSPFMDVDILVKRIAVSMEALAWVHFNREVVEALAAGKWKAVPVEPTRIMWAAMGNAAVRAQGYHHDVVCEGVYRDGIAAAPEKPE